MRILVTGSTSMLGRATVDRLVRRGDVVTVFQRGKSNSVATEVRGDLTSRDDVEQVVIGQEAVVHLAAKVGVTGQRDEFERVNVGGTESIVDAARRAGVTRFVHVSSPSVAHAGSALAGVGADVADPLGTRGHYATSKARAELAAFAGSSADMSVVAIRPHLVWGPGDQQLVGRIVERARSGRLMIVGSGMALIDTTYIDNAADALVAALDASPEVSGRAFVVSNGQPRTVSELVARIVSAAGVAPPKRHVPRKVAFGAGLLVERVWDRGGRTDDPPMTSFLAEQLSTAHWFDQRETRRALRWQPEVSLDEGFALLAESFNRG